MNMSMSFIRGKDFIKDHATGQVVSCQQPAEASLCSVDHAMSLASVSKGN